MQKRDCNTAHTILPLTQLLEEDQMHHSKLEEAQTEGQQHNPAGEEIQI
jgi:hypothetical protein